MKCFTDDTKQARVFGLNEIMNSKADIKKCIRHENRYIERSCGR